MSVTLFICHVCLNNILLFYFYFFYLVTASPETAEKSGKLAGSLEELPS